MKAILSAAVVFGLAGLALAQDKADPVGTWKLEYEVHGQKDEATLVIKKDGDKLAGAMSWGDQKDAKLTDVKLAEGKLAFSVVREVMDIKLLVQFTLKVEGDKLKGKAKWEFGGQAQETDIEGKREKMKDK